MALAPGHGAVAKPVSIGVQSTFLHHKLRLVAEGNHMDVDVGKQTGEVAGGITQTTMTRDGAKWNMRNTDLIIQMSAILRDGERIPSTTVDHIKTVMRELEVLKCIKEWNDAMGR